MKNTAKTKTHASEEGEGRRWREDCTTNQPLGNKLRSESMSANFSQTFGARLCQFLRDLGKRCDSATFDQAGVTTPSIKVR